MSRRVGLFGIAAIACEINAGIGAVPSAGFALTPYQPDGFQHGNGLTTHHL